MPIGTAAWQESLPLSTSSSAIAIAILKLRKRWRTHSIRKATRLQFIGLRKTNVVDLTPLEELTELKQVILKGDAGHRPQTLHRLINLQNLDVCDTKVTDEEIARLEAAPSAVKIER